MNDRADAAECSAGDRRDDTLRALLAYGVLPAWALAGLLDWYWHRQMKIERNAGAFESITHILMALEAGAGALMGLFLEIDAGVIAAIAASAIAHEATVMWDVGYARERRLVPQREQHTHSFLEVLPFAVVAFTIFAHPDEARALARPRRARFRFKPPNPPIVPLVAIVMLTGVCGVGPYVEELIRCLRTKPTLAPQPKRIRVTEYDELSR